MKRRCLSLIVGAKFAGTPFSFNYTDFAGERRERRTVGSDNRGIGPNQIVSEPNVPELHGERGKA